MPEDVLAPWSRAQRAVERQARRHRTTRLRTIARDAPHPLLGG